MCAQRSWLPSTEATIPLSAWTKTMCRGFRRFMGRRPPRAPPLGMTTQEDTSLCQDPTFDTIFNSADGFTYIFKGSKYWRLTEESIAPGYPKIISEGWPGLVGNIDAAFTYKNGKSYFFKGSKYW
ncbi:hypothetical protein HUJ04_005632, partial [Dendroctonus ponderosae]